jgi:hypothetical protein
VRAFYVTAIDASLSSKGFFVAVDCAVAKVEAVAAAVCSSMDDTIDSSRHKLTAVHNETSNSRRGTLSNNVGELNDVHRHCAVDCLTVVLRSSVQTPMNFVANNRDVREIGFLVAFYGRVSDIRRTAQCSNVVDLANNIESETDLIRLNAALKAHKHSQTQAKHSHSYFATSKLASKAPSCFPTTSTSPPDDDNPLDLSRNRKAMPSAVLLLCKCSAIFPMMETTCRFSIRSY